VNDTYAQRLRVTYATGESVKYVGHLDFARAWERALRRARLPLAYTQGFNPQPRIQFAAALPVGFTAQAELVDVFLNEEVDPGEFVARLAAAMPAGIRPLSAVPVARQEPSLQSALRAAEYTVEVETGEDGAAFEARLVSFLQRASAPRERRRGKQVVAYDLRPLVLDARYGGPCELGHSFTLKMRSEPGATGRPDELLAELGYEAVPRQIERTNLLFA